MPEGDKNLEYMMIDVMTNHIKTLSETVETLKGQIEHKNNEIEVMYGICFVLSFVLLISVTFNLL
jgi:hypothetical protein